MPQIVEVKHLSKTFTTKEGQVDALRDINLSIEKGDIYGIIGMSGAGKSTLVRCLNFLEVPTSGQVIVEGQDLGGLTDKELRALRSSIGMIFQSFNLLMQKSVIDNVCFPLQIQGIKKKDAVGKARELLKTVGLEDKEKAYPAQLSGGQRQRVAIARALACDPKILLCDEATSALDPQTTASILDLLKKINAETGITIIIITHKLREIMQSADECSIIRRGVYMGVVDVKNSSETDLASRMVGRNVNLTVDKTPAHPGDVVLSIRGLTVKDDRGIEQVRNLDLVVGGHSHTFLDEMKYATDPDGREVPIVQNGCWGLYMGKIEIDD